MKKIYVTPELEEVKFEIEAPILVESGGGIADDGSATKTDDPVSDPNSQFGWGDQE